MYNMTLFSFLIQYLKENKCCLTDNFEVTGLKHYVCELFSPMAHAIGYSGGCLHLLTQRRNNNNNMCKVIRSRFIL